MGTAQTGTGKTLCYGITCINKLLNDRVANALIICPTRELAVQIGDVLNGLIENSMNIKSAVLIGGESMQKQLKQLHIKIYYSSLLYVPSSVRHLTCNTKLILSLCAV